MKRAQVSVEYLIMVGFLIFVLIGILVIAFLYTGMVRDKIKMNQISDFAKKTISTAESLFYAGPPSKATIFGYLPETITKVEILENSLVFVVETDSGENKIMFSSNVPLSGDISDLGGLNRLELTAQENSVFISSI